MDSRWESIECNSFYLQKVQLNLDEQQLGLQKELFLSDPIDGKSDKKESSIFNEESDKKEIG